MSVARMNVARPIPAPAAQAETAGQRAPRSADMHPGPGFRWRHVEPPPVGDLAERFAGFDVPDISDYLNRLYAVDSAIHALSGRGRRLACTVRVYPGDNLMVHKALDVARPGQVVVVDARGSNMNAVLGDILSTKARHRGVAGFVVDGYVRDLPAIRELDIPVYARGETPVGPMHRGPGEINYPVCCGGVVVHPCDVVIADAGGVVVVPLDHLDDVLRRLCESAADSRGYRERVAAGQFSNAWVDEALARGGCEAPLEHPA